MTVVPLVEQAVALAASGLAVFPLGPTRVPLEGSHGYLDASSDEAVVRRLFAADRIENIGIATGERSGIDILDLDPRNGSDDFPDLARLPVTRVYETRRGGRHYVFRHAPGLRCSAGRIALGVDVKADGGYATYHPAAGCPVLVEGPIVDWPDWLLNRAIVPVRTSAAATGNASSAVTVSARDAINILDALPNPESNSRDSYVAVMLAASGAAAASDDPEGVGAAAIRWADRWPGSPGHAVEADRWESDWSHRGEGPAGFAHLHARACREIDGFAAKAAAGEFPPLSPPLPAPKGSSMRDQFAHPADCATGERRGYIIKHFLAPGDVGAIVGQPGTGKSMLAPYLAYAVAQGVPVFGLRTKQGRTMYLAAEDAAGMRQRIHALYQAKGDAPDFAVVPCGSLRDEANVRDLHDAVSDWKPALVVIDTLGAAFAGMDENSAVDMGNVVALVRRLARDGCAVLLVHHIAKSSTDRSPRGHSVLNGTLDVSLCLEDRDADGVIRGKLGKNRNGTTDRQIAFRYSVVDIGTDEDGDSITAPMAIELEPGEAAPKPKLTPVAVRILSVLRVMASETGEVAEADWRARCDDERAASPSEKPDSRNKAFNRGYQALLSTGAVTAEKGIVRLAGAVAPEFSQCGTSGSDTERADTPGQIAVSSKPLFSTASDSGDKSGHSRNALLLSTRQRRAESGQTRTTPLGVVRCPVSAGSPDLSLKELMNGFDPATAVRVRRGHASRT
jgi:KaiC/GvpD/RAD55 family RecA-like ATPase